MSNVTTKRGDTLQSIAESGGTTVDAVCSANASLARLNPCLCLEPGTSVSVPTATPTQVSGSTGQAVKCEANRPAIVLRLRLSDPKGNALANAAGSLTPQGVKKAIDVVTKSDGTLVLKSDQTLPVVPKTAKKATLAIGGRTLQLVFDLGPARTTAGVASLPGVLARLRNLGYHTPWLSKTLALDSKVAIAAFQADAGVQVSGEPDAATLDALEAAHGG